MFSVPSLRRPSGTLCLLRLFCAPRASVGGDRTASQMMMHKFQLEVALRAMQTQRSLAAQKRRAMGMAATGPIRAEPVTIRDLLTFQQVRRNE